MDGKNLIKFIKIQFKKPQWLEGKYTIVELEMDFGASFSYKSTF